MLFLNNLCHNSCTVTRRSAHRLQQQEQMRHCRWRTSTIFFTGISNMLMAVGNGCRQFIPAVLRTSWCGWRMTARQAVISGSGGLQIQLQRRAIGHRGVQTVERCCRECEVCARVHSRSSTSPGSASAARLLMAPWTVCILTCVARFRVVMGQGLYSDTCVDAVYMLF